MEVEMIQLLAEGEAKARKAHQCYNCSRYIEPGEVYSYSRCVCDGRAYTVRSHRDCRAAALDYISEGYPSDYEDGVPPLIEMMADSGDLQHEINRMRGHFPHVAARIEINEQLAEIRYQERLREMRA
jgi:hypothetical protein